MELERDRWADYFRSLVPVAARHLATVETLCASRAEARDSGQPGRRLRAICYSPEEDQLEVAVGGVGSGRPALRFFVPAPKTIAVTEQEGSWRILIDDASGARTLICLLDPLRAREVTRRRAPATRRSRPGPALEHRRGCAVWAPTRRGCGSQRRAAPR
jgi:hypothetical protein